MTAQLGKCMDGQMDACFNVGMDIDCMVGWLYGWLHD